MLPSQLKPSTFHYVGEQSWLNTLHKRYIRPAATKIEEECKRRNASDFLLVIDECTGLDLVLDAKPSKVPSEHMSLFCLQRTLEACRKDAIWTLLLDTTSSIQHLVPATGEFAPSARLEESLVPLPPFSYFAYDVLAPDDNLDSAVTAEEGLLMSRLKKYGRPVSSTICQPEDHY